MSGYLIQLTADVKSLDGPSGPAHDFTDLHAWAEVYVPGAGWIGLDPTSGLLAGEGHIPLACTASPGNAAPVTGSILGDPGNTNFEFAMTVTRLREDPRVTKPYTDQQWQAIDALGHAVDRELVAGDVRLTQGGEPTFVSIDDMEGPEWNYTALSPAKLELATALQSKLQQRLAPGALLHHGQGKWYPGEPLPRWALGIYWRKDGKPVWRNPRLIAAAGATRGAREARQLIDAIARELGFSGAFIMPAFEDTWLALDKESELPVNVDPLAQNLTDAGERSRLAAQLRRGLAEPVGYVLPLRAAKLAMRKKTGKRWESSLWPLRRQHLLLLSGDSALGYRLPLGSLPEYKEPDDEDLPYDPFAPLPELGQEHAAAMARTVVEPKAAPTPAEIVRTALCVEPRDGILHVYMPPIKLTEDYLALISAVEAGAGSLQFAVRIEGYEPPTDVRLNALRITPDPGVIEVNIHPVAQWDELVANTTALYADARATRLATEKFMLDGRHTGTGGGNHVTLGGITPADSPLLRRPDLLKSLVTYWQNHPALSFMFAGQFVGPTSQAPRVDEARDDNLYELEIAFQQMARRQQAGQETLTPWLVDRLLRNLLVDLTGNTHRAEFCIDKLYSPDTAAGRLGLLEFRAFEMPPHAQMSLTQMLLLRALLARFWKTPYQGALIRWGTQLHDRFMLPHFIAADMRDVVRALKTAGDAFDAAWFDPFIEFRFPRYGTVTYNNIQLELRQAIEPWNVLGEQVTAGATARYVDSLGRAPAGQKSRGLTGHALRRRYLAIGAKSRCTLTGVPGESVAGVRYRYARGRRRPRCIRRSVCRRRVVFDIIDTWSGRSIGGCTYHCLPPGRAQLRNVSGQSPTRPEARSHRALDWSHGHTPGPQTLRAASAQSRPIRVTLDLRYMAFALTGAGTYCGLRADREVGQCRAHRLVDFGNPYKLQFFSRASAGTSSRGRAYCARAASR